MEGFLWRDVCELKVAKTIPNIGDIVDEEDEYGDKALIHCLQNDCFDTFCYFVDCGANIYIKDVGRESLLHLAVLAGSKECVGKLFDAGIWVDVRDEYGLTPLHYAMLHRKEEIVSLLLVHKANINAICDQGTSPLDCALDFGNGSLSINPDPKETPYLKTMILMGAKLNECTKEYIPILFRKLFEKLGACKSASIALRRALKKQNKIHRDLIPMIEKMVFETHENDVWKKEEE